MATTSKAIKRKIPPQNNDRHSSVTNSHNNDERIIPQWLFDGPPTKAKIARKSTEIDPRTAHQTATAQPRGIKRPPSPNSTHFNTTNKPKKLIREPIKRPPPTTLNDTLKTKYTKINNINTSPITHPVINKWLPLLLTNIFTSTV